MKFTMYHFNFNVLDIKRSLAFYEEAFGFTEKRRKEAADGSYLMIWIGNDMADFDIELTWLRERTEPYNLGDEEFHLGIHVDDYNAAHEKHEKMGCIAYENPEMGIYFVTDPDGYWLEVVPEKK